MNITALLQAAANLSNDQLVEYGEIFSYFDRFVSGREL